MILEKTALMEEPIKEGGRGGERSGGHPGRGMQWKYEDLFLQGRERNLNLVCSFPLALAGRCLRKLHKASKNNEDLCCKLKPVRYRTDHQL